MNKVGIDIGGTKIECCVLSEDNTVIFRERMPTQTVYLEIEQLYNKARNFGEHTLGICMPGSISTTTGLLKNSNISFLNNTNFIADIEKIVNKEIVVANDAQCFALAESLLGSGIGFKTVFGMILGTGVGGGLVIDGKIFKGKHSICTEWGHTSLDSSNSIVCRCGRTGCVETWLSGTGLKKWADKMYNQNLNASQHLESETVQNIYFARFGLATANLIQYIDPDCIVIGGGISNNNMLYTSGIENVRKFLFNDELRTPIVKAKLGDSAGVIGAALLHEYI